MKFGNIQPGRHFYCLQDVRLTVESRGPTFAPQEYLKLADPKKWTHGSQRKGHVNAVSVDGGKPFTFTDDCEILLVRPDMR